MPSSSSSRGGASVSAFSAAMDSRRPFSSLGDSTESAPKRSKTWAPPSSNPKPRRDFPWDQLTEPSRKPRPAQPGPKTAHVSKSGSVVPEEPKIQRFLLSPEQQKVYQMVVSGKQNVFFTGSAGTGKSVLLREIIDGLRKKFNKRNDAVAVTASTGLAACNVGGTTVHSFAGIGLGQGTTESLVTKVKKNKKASSRWLRTEALVIDEVSMLDGKLFDNLAAIASIIRKKKDQPFGGIQLILTGDFFQLPPVSKNSSATFAFEAKKWNECVPHTVNLTQVFRQKDQEFIDMLNEMRFGRLSQESISKFRSLSRELKFDDEITPTELFPMRMEVERANSGRLRALPSDEYVFNAHDFVQEPQEWNRNLLENLMAPPSLTLKVGAQVMVVKNLDESIVNGSIGTIVGFGEEGSADVNLADQDDNTDFDFTVSTANKGATKAVSKSVPQKPKDSGKLNPIVEFRGPNGRKFQMPMKKHEFKIEDNDIVKATRTQLPLILAWSMSIHKSQGQTLDRVKVDLGRIFEKGQAYVALSRCTSLEGLQVLGFDPVKVQAHSRVIEWSKTLSSISF